MRKPQFVLTGDGLLVDHKRIVFPHPVAQIEVFDDMAVVRLEPLPGFCFNQNVFGVSAGGKIVWQIPPEKHVYVDSPYTAMIRDGQLVKALNWDGSDVWLDPRSGHIVKRGFSK